jgi:hypothetical protein
MISIQRLLLVLLVLGNLSSCIITKKFSSIQFEVLTPSEIILPENIKTVALINRDLHCTDTSLVINYSATENKVDTMKNLKLANNCTATLTYFLKDEGKFESVTNYSDTLYKTKLQLSQFSLKKIFNKTQTDLCVFIDSLYFNEILLDSLLNLYQTKINLKWSFAYRTDTSLVKVNREDSLIFDFDCKLRFYGKKAYLISYLYLACKSIGNHIGTKIVPTWNPVQRIYYHSKNQDMLKGEEFIRQREWLKAAEILNMKTKSKNRKLAAKARFNIALTCEMLGNPDTAIEWLNKSNTVKSSFMKKHEKVCKQYIEVLTLRKLEIERLEKQVSNLEKNTEPKL